MEHIERHLREGELERVQKPAKLNFPLDDRSSGTSLHATMLGPKGMVPSALRRG